MQRQSSRLGTVSGGREPDAPEFGTRFGIKRGSRYLKFMICNINMDGADLRAFAALIKSISII
jgi:hypothetical protein